MAMQTYTPSDESIPKRRLIEFQAHYDSLAPVERAEVDKVLVRFQKALQRKDERGSVTVGFSMIMAKELYMALHEFLNAPCKVKE